MQSNTFVGSGSMKPLSFSILSSPPDTRRRGKRYPFVLLKGDRLLTCPQKTDPVTMLALERG